MSTVHVLPVNDLIEHDSSGDECPCGPTTEPVMRDDGSNGWLITHHSLDGRELDETATSGKESEASDEFRAALDRKEDQ